MSKLNVLVMSAWASAINYKNALRDRTDLNLHFSDANPYTCALYEPKITPIIVPRSRDTENYRKALDTIIEQYNIDILIPTSDHDMEGTVGLLHDGWDPPVKMFRNDYTIYHNYTHKAELMRQLTKHGIEVPRLYPDLSKLEFPLVIKPPREGGSKGVWIVNNQAEFDEKYAQSTELYGTDLVIQEFIPGETGSIYVALLLYGNDGKVYGEVASHSSLTYLTWGGGGNAGNIVNEPELLHQAKEIIRVMGGWKGPVNLEFKRHSGNGKFYLMEVNTRLNGYSYLTSMNGLNFPAAVIDLLTKGTTDYLSYDTITTPQNFIMTFREMPVDKFIDNRIGV